MKNNDLKNLTMKELLDISIADTPMQDVLLKLSTRESAAALAGFSVCAGYLLAILQQLRSTKPIDQQELEIWCELGRKEVEETYLRLFSSCHCQPSGDDAQS